MRDDLSHCKTPLVKGGQGRSDADAEETVTVLEWAILGTVFCLGLWGLYHAALALIAWGLA